MNFKEVYKNANNKITANDKLYDEILKKHKNTKNRTYRYTFTAVAAALAVMVALINVRFKNQEKTIISATNIIPSVIINSPQLSDAQTSKSARSQVSESVLQKDVKTKQLEASNTKTEIKINNIDELKKLENPVAQNLSDNSEIKTVSASEYYKYLGMNLKNTIYIPSDMTFEPECEKMFTVLNDTGEILTDTAVFNITSANDLNRYITISTSKLTTNAQNIINNTNYDKSVISDVVAIIIQSKETFKVYFINNGTDIEITTQNITQNELTELLQSLINQP